MFISFLFTQDLGFRRGKMMIQIPLRGVPAFSRAVGGLAFPFPINIPVLLLTYPRFNNLALFLFSYPGAGYERAASWRKPLKKALEAFLHFCTR